MIRDAEKESITDRKEIDQEANEQVRAGVEQFSTLMENNPDIKTGLGWFVSPIMKWDFASVSEFSRENRSEHIDAWALQRDANYAYSDRKRLFDMGHDKRFEEAYSALVRHGINSTPGDSGE